MTDETIKDLFYGNLNLFDRPMHRNEEYKEALNKAAEARDALEATMTDEQKKLLDAYVDAETGKMYEFYVRIEENWEELARLADQDNSF